MGLRSIAMILIGLFKAILCLTLTEEIANKTGVIKTYLGTFSDNIGTDLWIWVGIVAGGTFFVCIVIYSLCVFFEFVSNACCGCCDKKKSRKSEVEMSRTRN